MGVVSYRPDQSGAMLERQGIEILEFARKEQERIDTTAAEDALNKLREQQLDLTDGENGFGKQRGEAAIKEDFYTGYRDKLDKSIGDIGAGLSPAQQAKFRPRANMVRIQFNEGVLRHSAREGDGYAKTTFEGIKTTEAKVAQVFWQDPNAIAMSKERVTAAVDSMAERFGWSKEVKEAERMKAVGALHAEVIDRAMANENFEYAEDWYRANKNDLDPSVYEKIKKDREAATFETRAFELADTTLQKTGNDYYAAKQKIRENAKDGKLAKEAIYEIERRENDFLQKQDRLNKESVDQGHLMIEEGVSRTSLKKSEAYKNADPGGKAGLLNTWDSNQRERRAAATGASEVTTQAQWERWADLSSLAARDPDAFKKLDIKSELYRVPKGQRDNLIGLYNKAEKDPAAQKETLSLSQQMGVVTRDLDKADRGKFEGAVYSEILAEERAGKKLGAQDRQKIIDRLTIDRDVPWYKGGDKKTFELAPTDRNKYQPVPSKDDITQIREQFKKRGIDKPTDEQIMGIYKTWKGIP